MASAVRRRGTADMHIRLVLIFYGRCNPPRLGTGIPSHGGVAGPSEKGRSIVGFETINPPRRLSPHGAVAGLYRMRGPIRSLLGSRVGPFNSTPIAIARDRTAEALLPIRSPTFKALQPFAAASRSCASCSAVHALLAFRLIAQ